MISIDELKTLVKTKEQQIEENNIKRRAADLGICPNCGKTPLKETSYYELSGESDYKCLSCGWSGEGEMGI